MLKDSTTSFSKRLFAAGRSTFWLAAWLFSLCLILLYPIRWLSGDTLRLARVVSYITPWILAFSILLLIIAGLARRKWLSLVLGIPIFVMGFNFAPLFLPNKQTLPPPNSLSLKVMSFNLHSIQKAKGIADVIRREKPDILLVQELNIDAVLPFLKKDLADIYPDLYVDAVDQEGFKQAILSRYPVKHISAEFEKGRLQKTQIETPSGSIVVWNVHPIPPFLVPPEQYDTQISALAADIAATKGSLIVGGDFNATDQSEAYRMINKYLKNAYWEAGWGFGFSYPAPPYTFMDSRLQTGPLWRIDHVFYSQNFIATNARTLTTSGGSDHFPMVAELSLIK